MHVDVKTLKKHFPSGLNLSPDGYKETWFYSRCSASFKLVQIFLPWIHCSTTSRENKVKGLKSPFMISSLGWMSNTAKKKKAVCLRQPYLFKHSWWNQHLKLSAHTEGHELVPRKIKNSTKVAWILIPGPSFAKIIIYLKVPKTNSKENWYITNMFHLKKPFLTCYAYYFYY